MKAPAILCAVALLAATPPTPTPVVARLALEGITLGQTTHELRAGLGDPIQFVSQGNQQIWRYLEHGGAVYVDVLVRDNAAMSVTVVRRFSSSPYTDENNLSFGMSAADVKAKLGEPARQTTNSDDGSIDLWYFAPAGVRIYEFYGDKLGFIQILPPPHVSFASEVSESPADGTSVANAIRIRPSDFMGNSMWIDAFLAMNVCGGNGHWKESSLKMQPDATGNDLMAFTIVHAQCTSGTAERDFYFDTAGVLKKGANGQNTIYIDVHQLPHPEATATPSSAPSAPPSE